MLIVLLATLVVAQLATLRPGSHWGGDATLYVMHGRNIAEGRPYAVTEFLFNEASFASSQPGDPFLPPTYPPGLPVLLAPFYALAGLDLVVLKIPGVICFALSLLLLYAWQRRHVGIFWALGLVAIIGANPVLWHHKDIVATEYPYLMWSLLALLSVQRAVAHPTVPLLRGVAWGIGIGIAAYGAYATRSVGGLVFGVCFGFAFLQGRRQWPMAATIALVFGALAVWQNALLHSVAGYAGITSRFNLSNLPENLLYDWPRLLGEYFVPGPAFLRRAAGFALGVLAAAGVVFGSPLWQRRAEPQRPVWRSWIGPVEAYAAAYLALFGFFQLSKGLGYRYLIPVTPILIALALLAVRNLAGRRQNAALATLCVAVAISYTARHLAADLAPFRYGIESNNAMALYERVRDMTSPDEILVFGNPRVLALYTGRRVTDPYHRTPDELMAHIVDVGATLVVAGGKSDRVEKLARTSEHARNFEPAFRQGRFRVYHVRDCAPECPPEPSAPQG